MRLLTFVKAAMVSSLFILLIACGSKWEAMSNQELAMKNDECVQGNPTSPGKVTACENIRKECERRRGEGNFAC